MSNTMTHIKFPNEEQEREVIDKAGRELAVSLTSAVHEEAKAAAELANEAKAAAAAVSDRVDILENNETGNLLENVGVTNGIYIDDNGVQQSSSLFNTTDFIPVKGGTAVFVAGTIGSVTNSHRRLHAYTADRTWIEQTIDINVAGLSRYDGKGSLPLNAAYVRFCYRNNDSGMLLTASVQVDTGAHILLEQQERRIAGLSEEKQNKLIAGDNITINGNVISATGGGGGVDLDPTLTDPTKAAPADIVGDIKSDMSTLKDALIGVDALADEIGEVVGV